MLLPIPSLACCCSGHCYRHLSAVNSQGWSRSSDYSAGCFSRRTPTSLSSISFSSNRGSAQGASVQLFTSCCSRDGCVLLPLDCYSIPPSCLSHCCCGAGVSPFCFDWSWPPESEIWISVHSLARQFTYEQHVHCPSFRYWRVHWCHRSYLGSQWCCSIDLRSWESVSSWSTPLTVFAHPYGELHSNATARASACHGWTFQTPSFDQCFAHTSWSGGSRSPWLDCACCSWLGPQSYRDRLIPTTTVRFPSPAWFALEWGFHPSQQSYPQADSELASSTRRAP